MPSVIHRPENKAVTTDINHHRIYDCIIVGGGLAGLSLSILLARQKRNVLVLEKKSYPTHKVCGEYISMESHDFLKRLGVPVDSLNLPMITRLLLTSVDGISVEETLTSGGFGMSRYALDQALSLIAIDEGVTLLQNTNVSGYQRLNGQFEVTSNEGVFKGTLLCASFGKHAFGNFYKSKGCKKIGSG